MFVAILFENQTQTRRASTCPAPKGHMLAELLTPGALVCARIVAISLTFFGFTHGQTLAGGAGVPTGKGAESSVLFGGERA